MGYFYRFYWVKLSETEVIQDPKNKEWVNRREDAVVYRPREMTTKAPEEKDKGNRDRITKISFILDEMKSIPSLLHEIYYMKPIFTPISLQTTATWRS